MKKAIVLGCPGSGKTTFAEKLRPLVGLPLYYLDAIWHKPDRTHISRTEFDARMQEILAENTWIIDGNYSRTLEVRLRACDTVFFFDLSTEDCLWGATVRLGKERYDMPWIDKELEPRLEQEIVGFRENIRPGILEMLDRYHDGRQIEIFTSREAADAFLDKL